MPRWLIWSILALACWGVWAILSKIIGDALSAAHSQALSTIGLIPIVVALAFSKRVRSMPGSRRGAGIALVAGTLACLGNIAYYQALNAGEKAARIVPLTALYPLVTVVLAVLLLREKLHRLQVAGIVLALVAIYLLNVPSGAGVVSSGFLYALLPIGFWGGAGLLQKLATNHISGERATIWFLIAFVPVAALILFQQPLPDRIAVKTWLLVGALGLFFAIGNYGILAAFAAQGKASVITPLTALYPIVSVPIAIVFLGETIGARESVGILLSLVSGAALSYEKQFSEAVVASAPAERREP